MNRCRLAGPPLRGLPVEGVDFLAANVAEKQWGASRSEPHPYSPKSLGDPPSGSLLWKIHAVQ